MNFFIVTHENGFGSQTILGLSQTIEEGLLLYNIDPQNSNLSAIKRFNRLVLNLNGAAIVFTKVSYDDNKIQQYLREYKLNRII